MKDIEQKHVWCWLEHMDFTGRLIVVVGAGQSGLAAARLGRKIQAGVTLLERDTDSFDQQKHDLLSKIGAEVYLGRHVPEQFSGADLVVLSPGVAKESLEGLLPENVPVVSELEMASWLISKPIIAVTGTNGKTTTASLIDHLLKNCGFKTFLGGNIGIPLSEYVLFEQDVDVLVLEVSSFQLQYTFSFRPNVAIFLNFSPNHLDQHTDMQDYLQAKLKIFQNQQQNDWAIFPGQISKIIKSQDLPAKTIQIDDPRWFPNSSLLGLHNQFNIEVALAACRCFGVEEVAAVPWLGDYQAYPHRLQRVGEKNGLLFVDDSKATTIDALRVALASFNQPICLLAGGRFKGGDPLSLAKLIQDKVKVIVLFGESRDIFTRAWQDYAPIFWHPTLEQAVLNIYNQATPGEVILLSPGTSSFDLFRNYKERGLAFQKAVEQL